MKARTHKLIGTIVVAMTTAGILAGGAHAYVPDWFERAAGAESSTAGTASTVVPLPDWVDRTAKQGRAGSAKLATKSTVVSSPDWIERAALRATGR
jgi:hypothetical protein